VTYNFDEYSEKLRSVAVETLDIEDVTAVVEPSYAGYRASVTINRPGKDTYIAEGQTPEEAITDCANFLFSGRVSESHLTYAAFAKQVREAILDQIPEADVPGNEDPPTNIYWWKLNNCRAQLQGHSEGGARLHLDDRNKKVRVVGYPTLDEQAIQGALYLLRQHFQSR
jgi:hypothetical protein